MKRKKGFNKKGFTLVEIIVVVAILVVIAGLFAVNMINTLNKNKETESKNVVSTITSAADAYVSSNPGEIDRLYNGYGYVDLKIGQLRDAGLIEDDLSDPETGNPIKNDAVVRAKLEDGDQVKFIYPVSQAELDAKAWTLVAEDLSIEYDANTNSESWCSKDSNIFSGLQDRNNISNNDIKSKLYLMDNSEEGKKYTKDYKLNAKLTVTSCNVNPQTAGTYQIEYKYTDPDLNEEKTKIRTVYVNTSGKDVIKFTATINEGKDIIKGSDSVPVTITEIYKDNTSSSFTTTTSNINNIKYNIENFSTSTTGTLKADIISSKTNSDGSFPASTSISYKVTDSLSELIDDSKECTPNNSSNSPCYYRGQQSGNYVKYNGVIYRIYYKNGNNIRLIYNNTDISNSYGQVGSCTNDSCCNSGRYLYRRLNDPDKGLFSNTMDTVLEDFYKNKISNPVYLNNISTIYGSFKVSLLTKTEYEEISSCANCKNNYLVGQNFWLLEASGSSNGEGNWNRGCNAAKAKNNAVNNTGVVYSDGASKETTWAGDYGVSNVTTSVLVVRPVIQLNNPKITSGDGTVNAPYVIG